MPEQDFVNQSVIVTGGASGIGAAAAIQFASRGADVLIADVSDADHTLSTIRAGGGNAEFVKCDVSQENDVVDLVNAALHHFGRLDACFNAAGIVGDIEPTADYGLDAWNRTIAVNLTGTFHCLKHQIPALLSNGGGAIVNTASAVGLVGIASQPAYTASKHGVVGLSKSAALDYANRGVRINVLCPGFTNTPMVERWIDGDPLRAEAAGAAQPMGRMGTAQELASAVVWMCSRGAGFMTGASLSVDGGYTTG